MFTENPFATLASSVPPFLIRAYLLLMIAFVVGGTLFDMLHKRNAAYFLQHRRKARIRASREVSGGEKLRLAVETAAEALVSGEFCNPRRRIAHLLTMYGFIAYTMTSLIMVFGYSAPDALTPAILPLLWHIGALLILIAGIWFWFFIRVDVAAEGNSPFRLARADLFIVSLVANAALALVWSWQISLHSGFATLALLLYLLDTILLFGSVPWSKFSHMFYKPAAAYQRRLEEDRGTRGNLPLPADKPEIFGNARELPRHY